MGTPRRTKPSRVCLTRSLTTCFEDFTSEDGVRVETRTAQLLWGLWHLLPWMLVSLLPGLPECRGFGKAGDHLLSSRVHHALHSHLAPEIGSEGEVQH